MNKHIVFIAPAAGRQPNPKHFLGYMPGGEGGGVNYDAFPDFGRLSLEPKPQCLPLVKGKIGDFTFDTEWRVASSFEIELRAQMHRIVRHLEEHPLSEQEYERLLDLAAMVPLSRKSIDDRLERLGLVEEYDQEDDGDSSVECTQLFYSQAYGQYDNIPYDGQLRLPYIDVHKKLCYMSQHTVMSKVIEALKPELLKEWLEGLNPETIVGHTSKYCGCPIATYLKSRLKLEIEIGNVFDLSSFSYEGAMRDLPDWTWSYAEALDRETITLLDKENEHLNEDADSLYPDYPSVPVKVKHALAILDNSLKIYEQN